MSESQSVVVLFAFECLQFSGNFTVPFVPEATFLICTIVARTRLPKPCIVCPTIQSKPDLSDIIMTP